MKKLLLVITLMPLSAYAQFYAGGGIGQTKLHGACDGLPAGISCDDTATGWKVFLGYQFNRNLAVEGTYIDFGKASASGLGATADAKANGFDVAAVGILPLANRFSLFGKLGIYRIDTKVSASGPGGSVSDSESNSDLTYGGGVQFDVTSALGIRGEWQRYASVGGDNVGGKSDVDFLGVSALVHF